MDKNGLDIYILVAIQIPVKHFDLIGAGGEWHYYMFITNIITLARWFINKRAAH